MSLRVLTLLLLTIRTNVYSAPDDDLKHIKKCCPEDQQFGRELACIDKEDTNTNNTNLDWFPVELIVNSSTLKIHQHHQDMYQDMLRDMYTVGYEPPECDPEFLPYQKNGRISFHYLLNEDFTMDVHVSHPKSGRLEDETIVFDSISDDSAAIAEEIGKGTLRKFPLADTCVDQFLGDQVHVLMICPCKSTTCISKCCPNNYFINETTRDCQKKNGTYVGTTHWTPTMIDPNAVFFIRKDSLPNCSEPIMMNSSEEGICTRKREKMNPIFYSNGTVQVGKHVFGVEQYCGEITWLTGTHEMENNLLYCPTTDRKGETEKTKEKSLAYGILFLVGALCLFLTVAVSFYLPDLKRRLHNKIAISHNTSLMAAYLFWGILQLLTNTQPVTCLVLTLLVQFTFLGAFFWLNVMCLDISLTFGMTTSLPLSAGSRRFLYYNIYSWGCTLLISIITLVMEFSPSVTNDNIRPGFSCSCGFNQRTMSILIYFYGPMMIILAVNLVMFIFTASKILSVQRMTTSALRNQDSVTTGGSTFQAEKQRLLLYLKLFLLMGLTWVMEIISWAVGGKFSVWYVTDIINLLRGVFIFVLFICKKNVLRSLRVKLSRQFRSVEARSTVDTGSTPWGSDSTKHHVSHRESSGGAARKLTGL